MPSGAYLVSASLRTAARSSPELLPGAGVPFTTAAVNPLKRVTMFGAALYSVLTSDDTAPAHILPQRVQAAAEAGCGGIVCAASDVVEAKELAPELLAVVPGIRPEGTDAGDQRRAATPREALDAGADLLVVGRPVTRAADRVAAAAAIVESLTG